MSIIEFKTKISYYQFQDLEKTLMVLELNNIRCEVYSNDRIDILNDTFLNKGDYIFFHNYSFSILSNKDFTLLSALDVEKLIKHLEENQIIEVK